MELTYNTQQSQIILTEYGRGVQAMVQHLFEISDKDERTKLAKGIVNVMINLNPTIKEQDNYLQTVWDHLHMIGDYKLDIDSEFPVPEPAEKQKAPEELGYKAILSRYRFYGRNLIEMIDGAKEMPDGELKTIYINYIASFMVNSSKNWNEEDLTPTQVVQHMSDLSEGKLQLDPSTIDIHIETRRKKPNHNQHKNKKNNNKKKYRRR